MVLGKINYLFACDALASFICAHKILNDLKFLSLCMYDQIEYLFEFYNSNNGHVYVCTSIDYA